MNYFKTQSLIKNSFKGTQIWAAFWHWLNYFHVFWHCCSFRIPFNGKYIAWFVSIPARLFFCHFGVSTNWSHVAFFSPPSCVNEIPRRRRLQNFSASSCFFLHLRAAATIAAATGKLLLFKSHGDQSRDREKKNQARERCSAQGFAARRWRRVIGK
jgi:hypothetical protein